MTSLQKKMEEVRELYKTAKPIRKELYTTQVYGRVYGYGPFDDDDHSYEVHDDMTHWEKN